MALLISALIAQIASQFARDGLDVQKGQKAKYSLRAHIVRLAPDSGLKSDLAGGPFGATRRHHNDSMNLLIFINTISG